MLKKNLFKHALTQSINGLSRICAFLYYQLTSYFNHRCSFRFICPFYSYSHSSHKNQALCRNTFKSGPTAERTTLFASDNAAQSGLHNSYFACSYFHLRFQYPITIKRSLGEPKKIGFQERTKAGLDCLSVGECANINECGLGGAQPN